MTLRDQLSKPDASEESLIAKASWLGWAVYLGTSWTWCIGMFLPVLLVRDYGIGGFIIFAIPNVLGGAAMGWVLRDASTSAAVAASHRTACVTFSAVTIAFHAFFATWMISDLTGSLFAVSGLASLAAFYVAARAGNRWAVAASVLVFLTSCSFFVWGVSIRELPYLRDAAPRQPLRDLWAIALVSTFGFVLCPYLDLTFHRARQQTSTRAGRLAFGVGFGVCFLVMILFTLAYSGWLQQLMARTVAIPSVVAGLIGYHMLVQSAHTTALHSREVASGPLIAAVILFVIIAVVLSSPWLLPERTWEHGYDLGETGYRLFMGAYALVFPAYVWLCMIGSATRPPSKRAVIVFLMAVVVASPMFWLGFIEGRMFWLLPGLGVVLLARLFVPRPFKWTA